MKRIIMTFGYLIIGIFAHGRQMIESLVQLGKESDIFTQENEELDEENIVDDVYMEDKLW